MVKFLCVCDGGNVRSHALAFVLHDFHGVEAIPIGRLRVSPHTMDTMCLWADTIVLMQPHMIESIPIDHHHKVTCVDVGIDRFGIYVHPELLDLVKAGAEQLVNNS